jgi:hypothetical protein
MSADNIQSPDTSPNGIKYSPDRSRYLTGNLAMTDHALDRFRERLPHGSDLNHQQVYRLGEYVEHPEVAHGSLDRSVPDAARVFRHRDGWGLVYLVTTADNTEGADRVEYIVPTILRIRDYNDPAPRAYFMAHGPHGTGGRA